MRSTSNLSISEWCIGSGTNMVRVYCNLLFYWGRDMSMFSDFEKHEPFIYTMEATRFVEWVEKHKVGTVPCYNYWEKPRL